MNRTVSTDLFKLFALLAVLALTVYRAFFGIDFTDSPFMLMSVTGEHPNWMLAGFTALTRIWICCFGETYLSLRFMQTVFGLATCLIPYLGLIPRRDWLTQLHWLILGILLWNTRLYSFHCDIPSLMFVSLAATLAIRYYRSGSAVTYAFLTAVTGIAVLCRFPNVVAFVILWLLLPAAEALIGDRSRRFCRGKMIAVAFVVCFVCCLIAPLLFGMNPAALFDKMTATVTNEFSGSHTLSNMARQMQVDLRMMTILGGGLFMIIALGRLCAPFRFSFLFSLVLCYPLCLMLEFSAFTNYNQNMRIIVCAMMLLFFGAGLLDAMAEKDRNKGMEILIIFLFGGVSMAGSNTGFINGVATWTSFFAPLAVLLTPTLTKIFPSKLNAAPLWIAFFFFIFFSSLQGFEDARYHKMTAVFSNPPKLQGIKTTPENAQLVADVLADYETLKKRGEVVFFGTRSHLFCWLTGDRRPFEATFWMFPHENENDAHVEKYLQNNRCVAFFVIPSKPHVQMGMPFPVDEILSRHGYRCVPKNNYRVYVK